MNTSTAGIRRATGQIVVGSFQKIAWNQLEGAPTLNHIHVTETFERDIEGGDLVRGPWLGHR